MKHTHGILTHLTVQFLAILFGCGLMAAVAADEPMVLKWHDLAPDFEPGENPFMSLTIQQTQNFRNYLQELQVPEMEHTVEQQQRLLELRAVLEADNLKPDEMVATYHALLARYQHAATAPREEVVNQRVELPGYLLPLSVSDGAVTEFLLVPTIGACIHEPTPPANQMVFVRFAEGFKSAGLYDPVWIRGELKAEARSEELHLVDGSAAIDVSYIMSAEAVWLY